MDAINIRQCKRIYIYLKYIWHIHKEIWNVGVQNKNLRNENLYTGMKIDILESSQSNIEKKIIIWVRII